MTLSSKIAIITNTLLVRLVRTIWRTPDDFKKTVFRNYVFNTFLNMVEPLLSGIVLGLIPVTLAGLFVTAYLQYRRGDRVTSSL